MSPLVDAKFSEYDLEDVKVLSVGGELCEATAPGLRERVRRGLDQGSRHIIVDLRDSSLLDAAGLWELFVAAGAYQQRHGSRLNLVVSPGPVAQFLELSDFERCFPVFGTTAAALTDLTWNEPDEPPVHRSDA
jgi:anti-anti-sigma factor